MGLFKKLFRSEPPRHLEYHVRLAAIVAEQEIDLIVDVGGNQGQFAQTMMQVGYAGPILSFEPGSVAYAALTRHAAAHPNWTVAPRMALGREAGEAQLTAFDRTDMNSLFAADPDMYKAFPRIRDGGVETVAVRRLDAVLPELAPTARRIFLKIDTQGSELAIIEGAAGIIDRVRMLQAEVPVHPIYEGCPVWMDVLRPIDELGFRPCLSSPGGINKRLNRQIDVDVVFVRGG